MVTHEPSFFTECTYHPMLQFVDWKKAKEKLFSLESQKCTPTNPKCKGKGSVEMDKTQLH